MTNRAAPIVYKGRFVLFPIPRGLSQRNCLSPVSCPPVFLSPLPQVCIFLRILQIHPGPWDFFLQELLMVSLVIHLDTHLLWAGLCLSPVIVIITGLTFRLCLDFYSVMVHLLSGRCDRRSCWFGTKFRNFGSSDNKFVECTHFASPKSSSTSGGSFSLPRPHCYSRYASSRRRSSLVTAPTVSSAASLQQRSSLVTAPTVSSAASLF